MVIPFAFLCQDPHLPRTSSSPSPVPSLQRQVALKQTSGLLRVFLTTSCSSCNARCNILQTDRHKNFLVKIYQSVSLNQKSQSHLKTKKKGRKPNFQPWALPGQRRAWNIPLQCHNLSEQQGEINTKSFQKHLHKSPNVFVFLSVRVILGPWATPISLLWDKSKNRSLSSH